jgi:hypothetical protein
VSNFVFPVSHRGTRHYGELGLTKRELFAAMAMQGLMSEIGKTQAVIWMRTEADRLEASRQALEGHAAIAVVMADALISTLDQQKEQP